MIFFYNTTQFIELPLKYRPRRCCKYLSVCHQHLISFEFLVLFSSIRKTLPVSIRFCRPQFTDCEKLHSSKVYIGDRASASCFVRKNPGFHAIQKLKRTMATHYQASAISKLNGTNCSVPAISTPCNHTGNALLDRPNHSSARPLDMGAYAETVFHLVPWVYIRSWTD